MICIIDGCGRVAHARGWCSKHYHRWQTHRDPMHVDAIDGRPPKYGTPGYDAAHKRVRRARGPATAHACASCGAPAKHWALVVVPGLYDVDTGTGYSLDVDDYAPMCVPCHYRFDGKRRVADPATGRVLGCVSARAFDPDVCPVDEQHCDHWHAGESCCHCGWRRPGEDGLLL